MTPPSAAPDAALAGGAADGSVSATGTSGSFPAIPAASATPGTRFGNRPAVGATGFSSGTSRRQAASTDRPPAVCTGVIQASRPRTNTWVNDTFSARQRRHMSINSPISDDTCTTRSVSARCAPIRSTESVKTCWNSSRNAYSGTVSVNTRVRRQPEPTPARSTAPSTGPSPTTATRA